MSVSTLSMIERLGIEGAKSKKEQLVVLKAAIRFKEALPGWLREGKPKGGPLHRKKEEAIKGLRIAVGPERYREIVSKIHEVSVEELQEAAAELEPKKEGAAS